MASQTFTPQLLQSVVGTIRREDFESPVGIDMTYLRDESASTGVGYVTSNSSIRFSVQTPDLTGEISSVTFEFDVSPASKYTAIIAMAESTEEAQNISEHVGSSEETVSLDITSNFTLFSNFNNLHFSLRFDVGEIIVSEIRIIATGVAGGKINLAPTNYEEIESDEGPINVIAPDGNMAGRVVIREGKVTIG